MKLSNIDKLWLIVGIFIGIVMLGLYVIATSDLSWLLGILIVLAFNIAVVVLSVTCVILIVIASTGLVVEMLLGSDWLCIKFKLLSKAREEVGYETELYNKGIE